MRAIAVLLVAAACGDDGSRACGAIDVPTYSPRAEECYLVPAPPPGQVACAAAMVSGWGPRLARREDGASLRAWRDAEGVVVEPLLGVCAERLRLPTVGAVTSFELALDEGADVAWADDAGAWRMALDAAAPIRLDGMARLTHWLPLGEGWRLSLPGPEGGAALWGPETPIASFGPDAPLDAAVHGDLIAFVDAQQLQIYRRTARYAVPIREVTLDPAGTPDARVAWLDEDVIVAWRSERDGRPVTHLARYDPSNFLGLYPGAVVELGLREVEGAPLGLAATSTQVVLATTLGEDECSPFAELTTMDTVLLPTRYDEVRTGIADERPRLAATADDVALALTRRDLTADADGAPVPTCTAPLFATLGEQGLADVVAPGAAD